MKKFAKISLTLALVSSLVLPSLYIKAQAAEAKKAITTTPTGYTCAEDVDYVYRSNYTVNWGARGEDCGFLSSYAEDFYTGSYVYDTLSKKSGGSTQSNAPSSPLYSSLKNLMTSKHSHKTSYAETKEQYRYTDCVSNDYAHISSFYSGKQLTGNWDGAATWNREHTWPNSKGLGGSDENDIMMLRPTWVQENSSRGNTAYGQSGSYFDPGESTRGDCARIVLYVYVRWGNTGNMWGTGGVMESMNVLLQWMEEDPVDTWEMGRNDAVESITGTRNVFVDYPEYAWLLFGKDIPSDISTPSGIAKKGTAGGDLDSSEEILSSESVPESSDSVVEDSSEDSSEEISSDSSVEISEDSSASESTENSSENSDGCVHAYGEWYTTVMPTDKKDGEKVRICEHCGGLDFGVIPAGTVTDSSTTEESSSEGITSSESASSSEDSSEEESSSVQESVPESSNGVVEDSSEDSSSEEMSAESSESEDSNVEQSSAMEQSSFEESSLLESSLSESVNTEASDSETGGALNGCVGSIGGGAVGLLLIAAGMYALKKKKRANED